jgi:flagellar motor component MotA
MDLFNLFTAAAVVIVAVAGAFPIARWLGTDRILASFSGTTFDPYRTMNDIISLSQVQHAYGPEAIVQQANGLRDPILARAVRSISMVSSPAVIRAHMERELFAPLAAAPPRWLSTLTSPILLVPVGLFCMVGAGALLTGATIGTAPLSALGLIVAAALYTLFFAQALTPATTDAANTTAREMLSRLVILEGVTALAECQPPEVVRQRLTALFPASEFASQVGETTQTTAARRAA